MTTCSQNPVSYHLVLALCAHVDSADAYLNANGSVRTTGSKVDMFPTLLYGFLVSSCEVDDIVQECECVVKAVVHLL